MTARPPPPITQLRIEQLIPYERNARTHSDAQVDQLVDSIKSFGWTNPILCDTNFLVIAGHGRLLAAKKMKLSTVPCIIIPGLSAAQRKALTIADNKLALNAGWDWETLRLELGDLKGEAALGLVGFSESELSNLFFGENDATAEWRGMPEFTQDDKMAWRTIKVHFKDAPALAAFAKLLGANITDETRYLWYPAAEIEKVADKRYDT